MILDKVLSDERKYAYATTIKDLIINGSRWAICKECNWHKSRDTILMEVRLFLKIDVID